MKLKDEFINDLSTKRLTVRFNTIKNPIFIPKKFQINKIQAC